MQAGLCRPDLISHHSDRSTFMLDIMIVADNALLEDAHSRKARYYDVLDIRSWIALNVSGAPEEFSSVTLNWRGLMAIPSANTLCGLMGLGRQTSSLLSAVTCERSLWIWKHFHTSTFRIPE